MHDLFDSFLPQYRAGFVRGRAGGAMCSYMSLRIDGSGSNAAHPSCASDFLLEEWGAKPSAQVPHIQGQRAQVLRTVFNF